MSRYLKVFAQKQQEITKEVAGIHVLLTRSLFGDGIPLNLPPTKNWFGLT